jgi:cell division protein FtsN
MSTRHSQRTPTSQQATHYESISSHPRPLQQTSPTEQLINRQPPVPHSMHPAVNDRKKPSTKKEAIYKEGKRKKGYVIDKKM